MADMNFNYFTAAETGQYTFYRIPKALFTEKQFQALSCEAKVLYGMMLDRMGLSIQNQWFDSQGVERRIVIGTNSELFYHAINIWVCKINCVNHHRLFDTPIFLSLKIFSTKLCIIGRNWQTIFLEGNDYVTGF